MDYTISQARRDFSAGYVRHYEIDRAPLENGWTLRLGQGQNAGPLVDTRQKQIRVFKTLDAVVIALEEIGFKVTRLVA